MQSTRYIWNEVIQYSSARPFSTPPASSPSKRQTIDIKPIQAQLKPIFPLLFVLPSFFWSAAVEKFSRNMESSVRGCLLPPLPLPYQQLIKAPAAVSSCQCLTTGSTSPINQRMKSIPMKSTAITKIVAQNEWYEKVLLLVALRWPIRLAKWQRQNDVQFVNESMAWINKF